LYSRSGGCWVAAGMALAGAVMAALLLPARPAPSSQPLVPVPDRDLTQGPVEPVLLNHAASGT
jgi:hypothetical protein